MPARPSRDTKLNWRKSRASADSPTCVEIASTGLSVVVRDSHNRQGLVLVFAPGQWSAFLGAVRQQG